MTFITCLLHAHFHTQQAEAAKCKESDSGQVGEPSPCEARTSEAVQVLWLQKQRKSIPFCLRVPRRTAAATAAARAVIGVLSVAVCCACVRACVRNGQSGLQISSPPRPRSNLLETEVVSGPDTGDWGWSKYDVTTLLKQKHILN